METKFLIITDLGRFKAYQIEEAPKSTPRLTLLEDKVLKEAHHRLIEGITDMAGRRGAPKQENGATPLNDDHNLRLEIKRRLIRQIAGHVERLFNQGENVRFWIAASLEINHQILGELSPAIQSRIEKNLPLDLTKNDRKDLLERFMATDQPAFKAQT